MKQLFLSFIFIPLFSFAHENKDTSSSQEKTEDLKPLPVVIVKMLEESVPGCKEGGCKKCCIKALETIQKKYNNVVPKEMSEEEFIKWIENLLKPIAPKKDSDQKP